MIVIKALESLWIWIQKVNIKNRTCCKSPVFRFAYHLEIPWKQRRYDNRSEDKADKKNCLNKIKKSFGFLHVIYSDLRKAKVVKLKWEPIIALSPNLCLILLHLFLFICQWSNISKSSY